VTVVARFPVHCNMWDGSNNAGPVPVFFCSDPEGASQRLEAFPGVAHTLCQFLSTRIKTTEAISATAAVEFIKAPASGRGVSPFSKDRPATLGGCRSTPKATEDTFGPIGDTSGLNLYYLMIK